jgi:predicted metal-binding membrane protein
LGVLAWDEAGPYVAGGAILAAAIYQLSALKNRSLRRCRNPRNFVFEHWGPVPSAHCLWGSSTVGRAWPQAGR